MWKDQQTTRCVRMGQSDMLLTFDERKQTWPQEKIKETQIWGKEKEVQGNSKTKKSEKARKQGTY